MNLSAERAPSAGHGNVGGPHNHGACGNIGSAPHGSCGK